ncbi:SSI family serine proteinase inhibitor [Sphaerisporangium sp. NPDC051017]|uniref:SSI family serine proteinase inhibitor n=1 Tax=Sphaerisporangium sp. NPDC051017 TaxID=3154636 RepID=UPI00344014D5
MGLTRPIIVVGAVATLSLTAVATVTLGAVGALFPPAPPDAITSGRTPDAISPGIPPDERLGTAPDAPTDTEPDEHHRAAPDVESPDGRAGAAPDVESPGGPPDGTSFGDTPRNRLAPNDPMAPPAAPGSAALPSASAFHPFPGGPPSRSGAHAKGISRALLLTLARGESVTPADRIAFLQCGPAGGTHPRASEACRLLDPVGGDITDLRPSRDTNCTKEYDPITVSASGLWDGNHLWFERTFGNRCELNAYTAAVFNY